MIRLRLSQKCNVVRTFQDQKLSFTNGTKEFTVNSILSGRSSDATGTVKSVTLSFGLWSTGNAAGYLILSFSDGSFVDNETITDDASGNAKASGTQVLETDTLGTPVTSSSTTQYDCLFSETTTSGNYVIFKESGKTIIATDIVFLPDNAIIEEGDFVTSIVKGYTRTYEVQKVVCPENFFSRSVDHVEAYLKAVTKRD